VIFSYRLAQHIPESQYVKYAPSAYDWLTNNLVQRHSGFVEDGINREQDGRIDTQWRFTYNQGLYVGAAVELGLSQATATSCSRPLVRL
jgi:predicted alpha-1,6-mannanase (GH76 family)